MKKNTFAVLAAALALFCCSCAQNESVQPETDTSGYTVTGTAAQAEEPSETPAETEADESISSDSQPGNSGIPEAVLNKFSSMSMKEKIYQMFIVTPESLTDDRSGEYITVPYEESLKAVEDCPVGGLILFAGNIETDDQVSSMISSYQAAALAGNGTGLFISVDEEGGDIARVNEKLDVNDVQDMEYYGQNCTPEDVYEAGSIIADSVSRYGFNLDFAPVADINLSWYNGLGNRCFGYTPECTAEMVPQLVRGLQDNGVCATLKHFPGIGSSDGDTHDGSVWLYRSYDELSENEFVPFRAGIEAGADFVMVSHVIVDGADEEPVPSDLSYTVVTEWLKHDLGFRGLAVTDAQSGMESVTGHYSAGEAAAMSVKAGIDIVLTPQNIEEAYLAVEKAAAEDKCVAAGIDDSVLKILQLKYKMGLLG